MKTYDIDIGVAKLRFKIDQKNKKILYQVLEQEECRGFGLLYADKQIRIRSAYFPDIVTQHSSFSNNPIIYVYLRGTNRHLDNKIVTVQGQEFSFVLKRIKHLYKIQNQVKKSAMDYVLEEVLE